MMRWHNEHLDIWTRHALYYAIVCVLLALIAYEAAPWLATYYAPIH